MKSTEIPEESAAIAVATSFCGAPPNSVHRFTTGLGHWVYDTHLPDGRNIVVRLAKSEQRADFLGAVHWSNTLRPLGIPLPEILATGELYGLPYLILERIAGDDLGNVYARLTGAERKTIASEVCRIQSVIATLPEGPGYGHVTLPEGPYRATWTAVIDASLERSRSRIAAAGGRSLRSVERVAEAAADFAPYFAEIRPTAFLDDITTKNVLVHEGRLSGIVDVDWLCFGDPLLTVGLTRAALLSGRHDPEYTNHWCKILNLSATQTRAVRFYAALFCVDFMSDYGQHFNRGRVEADAQQLANLEQLLDRELNEI